MKVLTLVPLPMLVDRGGAIRIYEEMKALKQKGIEIRCVTYHHGRDIPEIKFDRIPRVPFYQDENPGGSYLRLYLDFLLFLKALSVAIKMKPDLIHAHLHDAALCGLGLKKLLGIPVLLDAQGSLTQEMISKGFIPPSSRRYRFFVRLEKHICRHADKVLTSSYFLKLKIENEFKVEGVEYFGDGVNLLLFAPGGGGDRIKKEYGWQDKIVVIYTGILTAFQGIDLLLEAAGLVVKKRSEVRFLIVGFPKVDFYKNKAKNLGLDEAVIFTGRKSYFDMPEFLQAADIAISPKFPHPGEGNFKLFSYMASARPSIVLDTPDNREILGEAGWYCEATPESLAEGIITLAADKALREAMGQKALVRSRERFGWDKKADMLIKTYEGLISRKKRQREFKNIWAKLNWQFRNSYLIKDKAFNFLTNPLVVKSPPYRFFYRQRIKRVMAKGASFPLEVQIESTNACNARCSMCFRDEMDRKQGFMDLGLFRKIIDECAEFPGTRLCFSFCGEPLLDPLLPEKVRYAKSKGMEYIYFFTNMSLMDKLKGRALMEAGLDEIKVSMDGFTPGTYEHIRRGLDFEKVNYNLKEFLRERGWRNKPRVSIMITRLRENAAEEKLALKEWKGQVEGIVFKSFDTFARQIPSQSEEITYNKAYPGLPCYPCHYLWTQFMILWDGRVVLCCKDFNGKVVLGDISRQTVKEIWQNKSFEDYRERHRQGSFERLPLCKDCNYFSIWW